MAYTTSDDPSAHFQTALYTGNNSNRSITNDGNSDLQPDFIWGKSRSTVDAHTATDSSRGNTKVLIQNISHEEKGYSMILRVDYLYLSLHLFPTSLELLQDSNS